MNKRIQEMKDKHIKIKAKNLLGKYFFLESTEDADAIIRYPYFFNMLGEVRINTSKTSPYEISIYFESINNWYMCSADEVLEGFIVTKEKDPEYFLWYLNLMITY